MRIRLPSPALRFSAAGVAIAALALAGALLWLHFGPTSIRTASAGTTTKIAVGNFWFCNSSFQNGTCVTKINVGDTVKWNFSGFTHTSTSSGVWDSGFQPSGTSFSRQFNDPGEFNYLCTIHPLTMFGTIIVNGEPPTATPVTPTPTPTSTPTPTATPTATPTPTPEPGATFGAKLTGAQEAPPTGSAGTGFGTVVLDTTETSAEVTITWSGLGSTVNAWHIHCSAPRKVNAPIAFNPMSMVPGTVTWDATSLPDPVSAHVANLSAGLCYFNVHSTGFPDGEIRGQIVPQSIGGIAELPEVAGTPLDATGSSDGNAGLFAGVIVAVAAGTVALGGAAWYIRRQRQR